MNVAIYGILRKCKPTTYIKFSEVPELELESDRIRLIRSIVDINAAPCIR